MIPLRLYTRCKTCQEEILFSSFAADRFELARTKGNPLYLRCISCGAENAYHPNLIKAETNKTLPLIVLGSIVGLGIFLFLIFKDMFVVLKNLGMIYTLFYIMGIPFAAYLLMMKGLRKRVWYFNRKLYG